MRSMRSAFVIVLTLAAVAGAQEPAPVSMGVAGPQPVRVGLALSGGAALGLAHIGVLKVLEREGIPVVGVAGNSMGSLVGGVYCAGYSPAEIESIAVSSDWNMLFSSSVPFGAQYLPERQQAQRYALQLRHRSLFPSLPKGLVPLQNVEFLLNRLLADVEYNTGYDFDSLPIPYRAVAVDLVTGSKQVLKQGRLQQAIRSSIAIPGVFSPEVIGPMELVDGGVQQYLPVDPLRDFAPDVIIAVLTMKHNEETGVSVLDIISRAMDLVGVEDLKQQLALADVVIEPNVDPFTHSDFARAAELIAAGESAAIAALPLIRAKLAGRQPVAYRKPVSLRPLSMVRHVRFEGLRQTLRQTLEREMTTRPGSYLQFGRLNSDLVRVFNTGLFEDVNFRLEFGRQDSVDVVVEVKERDYGFYLLGARYDTEDELAAGLEVGQGNLWGSGASVRLALAAGNQTEARAGLTGTRVFWLPLGYRADGFWGRVRHDFYATESAPFVRYDLVYRGVVAEAGYIIGRDAFFTLGYAGSYCSWSGSSPFDTLQGEWVGGPRLRLEHNSCDNLDLPRDGRSFAACVFLSGTKTGSSRDFLVASARGEAADRLGSRVTLRYGYDIGVSFGDVSPAELFRTGARRLVGFKRDQFTSRNRLVVKGGLDLRLLDLFGQRSYPLVLQLMGNAGTFSRLDSVLTERRREPLLHWGAGIGLATTTPSGPVSIMLGLGDFLKKGRHAGGLNLMVSVGREFRYER